MEEIDAYSDKGKQRQHEDQRRDNLSILCVEFPITFLHRAMAISEKTLPRLLWTRTCFCEEERNRIESFNRMSSCLTVEEIRDRTQGENCKAGQPIWNELEGSLHTLHATLVRTI